MGGLIDWFGESTTSACSRLKQDHFLVGLEEGGGAKVEAGL